MYIRVYAPDGEAFDVPRERADKLILQDGWTQTPPKRESKKKKQQSTLTVFSTTDAVVE